MRAKFDRIINNFTGQQQSINTQSFGKFAQAITPNGGPETKILRHEGSERREKITDFKNKNLQNNMKGLLGKQNDNDQSDSESGESPNGLRSESPAIIEGVEENDESLNIKINKRKMFSKPPMIPPTAAQKT